MLLKRVSAYFICAWLILIATTFLALTGDTFAVNPPTNNLPGHQLPYRLPYDDVLSSTDKALVNRWLRPGNYMLPSEVRPGMEGYGLSVFQGIRPERFNVKVIGVLKKLLNGRDAILVRLSGASLGKNNVIRGMSGSPVYISGKLIGAISYGFDFSKEPICGVTPIVDMLDALAQDTQAPHDRVISRLVPVTVSPMAQTSALTTTISASAPRMVPLMSPIALSGFSPKAQEFLGDYLSKFGLSVDSGASGALDPTLALLPDRTRQKAPGHPGKASRPWSSGDGWNKDTPIQPGGALAVMLSTGDFPISATGTATACLRGNVIGFGHPFLQAGCVDFPMASAYVHQVLPCINASVKVASPIKVVGSVVSDRPWSVGGQIAKYSKLVPVTYTVSDETRHVQRTYHCSLVNHPDLTPELLAATAMSAVDATHQSTGPYVVRLESTIDTGECGTIHRVDRFASNFTPHALADVSKFRLIADPVGSSILNIASKIVDNEFQKAAIKSANFDIVLEDGHKTASIESVYIDNSYVAPGDEVSINCILRPYNQPAVTKVLKMKIPRDLPDGHLVFGVASGDEIDPLRKRMGLFDPAPKSLKQVMSRIESHGRGDAITCVMALPEQSIIADGVRLTNPPCHWSNLFFSNRSTAGPNLVRGEIRTSSVCDWLINGGHLISVEVRRDDKALARLAPHLLSAHEAQETLEGAFATELAKKTLENAKKPSINSGGPASESSDKPANASQTQRAHSPKDFPHMRATLLWCQDSEADFRPGKTESLSIDSWGRMSPAFRDTGCKPVMPDMQVWSGVFSTGYFWFSTKDKIYRWKGDRSEPELIYKVDSTIIPAMTCGLDGTIYAALVAQADKGESNVIVDGVGKDGVGKYGAKVIAIDPACGKRPVCVVFRTDEPIITSMCVDNHNNLYVGVCGTGRVYKLDLNHAQFGQAGKNEAHFDSGQAHVVSLFFNRFDERIYIGTAEKGAVYSIDLAGNLRAEYQTDDRVVTGIAKDSKGNLYVATAFKGHLVKVSPSGEAVALAASDAFYSLIYNTSTDSVYAGDGEGDITQAQIDPLSGEPFFIPVCHTDEEAVAALACDDQGKLFAGTANLAYVRSFEMKPSPHASYTSCVKDAQRPAQWSQVRVFGAYDETSDAAQKSLVVETRTGETSQPDNSWSSWKPCVYDQDSFVIASPPGRYFQYKLRFKPLETTEQKIRLQKPFQKPLVIGKIETAYLPNNLRPQFASLSLQSGSAISGKYELSVTGLDGDSDNLLLSCAVSSDGAKTWKSVVSNLRARDCKAGQDQSLQSKQVSLDETVEKSNSRDKDLDKQVTTKETKETSESKGEPSDKSGSSLFYYRDKSIKAIEMDPFSAGMFLNGSAENKQPGQKRTSKKEDSESNATKSSGKNRPSTDPKLALGKDQVSADRQTAYSTPLEKFSYLWDTTKFGDGHYIVKLELDDKLSHPDVHGQATSFRAVTIDNSPPTIVSCLSERKGQEQIELRITVKDNFTPVANATYRIDDGEPAALGLLEGTADGLSAILGAKGIEVKPGHHAMEIRITDKAGNAVTRRVSIH